MTAALSLHALEVVRGGRRVLVVDELEVQPGEILAVLGSNGAGKSTLLLAAALLLPAEGEVRLFGERAEGAARLRLRRQTATVFQDAALLDMSARRNIEVALRLHGVPRRQRDSTTLAWLQRLGVSDRADTRGHALSGGEAKRVSLARAFAVQPRLLFLDEPFSSLDFTTRLELIGDVRNLLRAEKTTTLLATHDHTEAELLADRAVVLVGGRVAQTGAVHDVLRRPVSVDVARFLGHSVVSASGLARAFDVVPPGGSSEAAVPPRAVRIEPGGVEASVLAVQGALGRVRLVVSAGVTLALERPSSEVAALPAVGEHVGIAIDLDRVTWL